MFKNADAIVSDAMEHEYPIATRLRAVNLPSAKWHSIVGGEIEILTFRSNLLEG
jgi:hypothetical protein